MRNHCLVALITAAISTPSAAVAQSDRTPTAIDDADLVTLLADFNAEHGAGPLDGCALQEAGRIDVAAVVARRPELAAWIDVVELPCSVEHHHPTRFNRGFVEAIRLQTDHVEVLFQTVVSDAFTKWTLRIVQSDFGPTIEASENSGVMYVHSVGQGASPPHDLASTAGALGLSQTVRFRIDGTLLVAWPQADSLSLVDVRGAWSEPGMGVDRAVGEHGYFLARLACLDTGLLVQAPMIAQVVAVSETDCEPRDDHRADILLGATRPVSPNLWRHMAFGITNGLVWGVEVTRDMGGTVLSSHLTGAVRLRDTGALAGG